MLGAATNQGEKLQMNILTRAIAGAALLFGFATWPAFAICIGYSGPGGPCYAGPGGPAYSGPGGPAYNGPGGPA